MPTAEEAARAFYNGAGGNYEMPAAASVAPAVPAAAAPPATSLQPAPAPAAPTEPEQPIEVHRYDPAADFYAPVETRGLVEWNEPAARAEQFDLPAPPGLLDHSPEGQAAMTRLRDGFAAAGAGVTIARELFNDAVRAQQDRRWMVRREDAEGQLRRHFGERYDAQIEGARALIQRAAARCPEIIPFLERTGLGNSPEFVRKIAAAASKRAGR